MGEAKRRKQADPNFGESKWQQNIVVPLLEITPDYENLVNLYLSEGVAALTSEIFDWLFENGKVYGETSSVMLYHANQISMTVCELASKQSKSLMSHDLKLANFTLNLPFEPDDFGSYASVANNRALAIKAMQLLNTGFFDAPITILINRDCDAVGTLRKHGIILYMGTNSDLEIIDAACGLVKWKPLEVVAYVGEQRNSLNALIEKTFRPLVDKIQKYRVEQKGADRFPCLSLLCLIENKAGGSISEFRRHYTAQSGGQLIISGFSSGLHSTVSALPSMNILGKPQRIPEIRGLIVEP